MESEQPSPQEGDDAEREAFEAKFGKMKEYKALKFAENFDELFDILRNRRYIVDGVKTQGEWEVFGVENLIGDIERIRARCEEIKGDKGEVSYDDLMGLTDDLVPVEEMGNMNYRYVKIRVKDFLFSQYCFKEKS
ncbi:MAG: hypothetical protein A3C50_02315 [Candidatus Staskawiczbacteria bacterium RIFCSPHIGHO2_02_FULL_43_16]|uniref:Uncharacterized protein n=1 Tax=Candidatus Staskawiczbacteria bacterium RIFCSPHIGHO2_01_FULL_41_41 TaxID=1802203 RepID=A0A1G2HWC3_9BACT|nr:MAG: hypothetical protein A2822_00685 [Candidatus Staskawiczbacteria bacterium RIFCSPHIGHO2_01_FULL_41_41]OGZ68512.1 MAG: hypothetical protein A3C50_02315 [Candidatus Staskawiczbacteria bacterium RIFCSPHIGHO2_02_FULL_43_16]OGZ74316.1 MAG: hypothetical protein A3A12_02750 [Candidatus Staskawiczbacteria bacterium RIFCSPLOWO2_01_FULL_43_17b]